MAKDKKKQDKKHEPKYKCLVRWTDGTDAGTFSIIPLPWVQEFNHEEYNNGTYVETDVFPIQWRETKKEPPGGWELFDGNIIKTSVSEKELNKLLEELKGTKSPKERPPKKKKDEIQRSNDKNKVSPKKAKTKEKKSQGEKKANLAANQKNAKTESTASKDPSNGPKKKGAIPPENMTPVSNHSDRKRPGPLVLFGNKKPKKNDYTLNDVMEVALKTQEQVSQILARIGTGATMNEPQFKEKEVYFENNVNMVDVGKSKKYGIPLCKWDHLTESNTSTAFGTGLMMALFEKPVLLQSNVCGGTRKRTTDKKTDKESKRLKLDPDKIQAIKEEVKDAFPNSYNSTGLVRALNVKLANLRSRGQVPKKKNDHKNRVTHRNDAEENGSDDETANGDTKENEDDELEEDNVAKDGNRDNAAKKIGVEELNGGNNRNGDDSEREIDVEELNGDNEKKENDEEENNGGKDGSEDEEDDEEESSSNESSSEDNTDGEP